MPVNKKRECILQDTWCVSFSFEIVLKALETQVNNESLTLSHACLPPPLPFPRDLRVKSHLLLSMNASLFPLRSVYRTTWLWMYTQGGQ